MWKLIVASNPEPAQGPTSWLAAAVSGAFVVLSTLLVLGGLAGVLP
jgi:hypothetical protein